MFCCTTKNRRDLETDIYYIRDTASRENRDVLASSKDANADGEFEAESDGESELEPEIELKAAYSKISQPWAVHGKLDNQDYREITAKLLSTGKIFQDPMVKWFLIIYFSPFIHLNDFQFKPNKYSISYNGQLENGEDASKFKWIRAKDLFHNPMMLKHGHSGRDVNQGGYFFSINFLRDNIYIKVIWETAGYLQQWPHFLGKMNCLR